jgi:hypothetical protein
MRRDEQSDTRPRQAWPAYVQHIKQTYKRSRGRARVTRQHKHRYTRIHTNTHLHIYRHTTETLCRDTLSQKKKITQYQNTLTPLSQLENGRTPTNVHDWCVPPS